MRFRTEDRCQLLPRGDRMPRPLRAIAIAFREIAPVLRIAWTTGTRSAANHPLLSPGLYGQVGPLHEGSLGFPGLRRRLSLPATRPWFARRSVGAPFPPRQRTGEA